MCFKATTPIKVVMAVLPVTCGGQQCLLTFATGCLRRRKRRPSCSGSNSGTRKHTINCFNFPRLCLFITGLVVSLVGRCANVHMHCSVIHTMSIFYVPFATLFQPKRKPQYQYNYEGVLQQIPQNTINVCRGTVKTFTALFQIL